MRVLVCAASKHGATAEIASYIADTLVQEGLETEFLEPTEVRNADRYDALVLGSAVYGGRWLPEMRQLASRLAPVGVPVWLFSSGPIGEPPRPEEDPVDISNLLHMFDTARHQLFSGKLDKSALNLPERALVAAFRAPEGDFRNWEEIHDWALDIARSLTAHAPR